MISNLYLVFLWHGAGSSFGYRYLIGTYAAALYVWIVLLGLSGGTSREKLFKSPAWVNGVWLAILTWLFKTPPMTTLSIIEGRGWTNENLQIETLKLFLSPVQLIRPFALSPPIATAYSWFLPTHPIFQKYAISGPALWMVTLAVIVSIGYLIWFGATHRSRRS